MARGANPRLVLLCLLHDASEAYIADVTRPVKRSMGEYREAERKIQNVVYEKFAFILPDEDEKKFVKLIDDELLYHEFYHYMGEELLDYEPELQSSPEFAFVPFEEAEREFLDVFEALQEQLDELSRVKVIGLDLDGTLLRNDKSVSERVKNALAAAAEQGIEIVPASGRSFEGIPDYVKELPGVHYLVTTDGAEVYEINGNRVYDCSMPCADAADIVRRIIERDVVVGAYIDGRGYMERGAFESSRAHGIGEVVIEYFRTTRTLVEDLPRFILENGRPVQIITPSFWDTSEKDKRDITEMVKDYRDMISVYGSPHNIDITHSKASKGRGISEIAKIKGTDTAYTAAFGDSENDAEMLRVAGFGFAMENGDRFAEEAADFKAPSNEDDGVAQMIEKLIIRKNFA
jgi:hypothetical protein